MTVSGASKFMIVFTIGKSLLHLNKVEDIRLHVYTIHFIKTEPENSWINVIPHTTLDVSVE